MLTRWLQSLVLVLALLINSQCYALCAVSPSAVATNCSSHCHHRTSQPAKNHLPQACHSQHSESVNPEQLVTLFKLSGMRVIDSADLLTAFMPEPELRPPDPWDVDASQGHGRHGISVFALLSTFRI